MKMCMVLACQILFGSSLIYLKLSHCCFCIKPGSAFLYSFTLTSMHCWFVGVCATFLLQGKTLRVFFPTNLPIYLNKSELYNLLC